MITTYWLHNFLVAYIRYTADTPDFSKVFSIRAVKKSHFLQTLYHVTARQLLPGTSSLWTRLLDVVPGITPQ